MPWDKLPNLQVCCRQKTEQQKSMQTKCRETYIFFLVATLKKKKEKKKKPVTSVATVLDRAALASYIKIMRLNSLDIIQLSPLRLFDIKKYVKLQTG